MKVNSIIQGFTQEKLITFRITLIYALVGGFWILFSDKLLSSLVTDPETFTKLGIVKGWFFIIATASLLYMLIHRNLIKIHSKEEIIKKSENIYRTIFENTGAATIIIEEDMTISLANSEFERISGYSKEEIEGKKSWAEFIVKDKLEQVTEFHYTRRIDPDAAPRNYETQIGDRSENFRNVFMTVAIIPETKQSAASILDITERKQMEETLKRRTHDLNERVKELNCLYAISNIVEGQNSLDEILTQAVHLIKPAMQYPEVTCSRIVLDDQELRTENFAESNWKLASDIVVNKSKIGSLEVYYLEERPEADKGPFLKEEVSLIKDISERLGEIIERKLAEEQSKLQQQQLIQVDKMATLGILVSGVAHEINNPNNFIMLNAKIIKKAWDDVAPIIKQYYEVNGDFALAGMPYTLAHEKIRQLITGLSEGTTRIQKIVQSLKDYARQDTGDLSQLVDVNTVVESATVIVNNLIKKSTNHFSVNYGEDIPRILGNLQQLEQVLINLITNSCQALQDKEQGITVLTAHDEDSNSVFIKVCDEGVGIPKENLKHILDPFFTTKRSSGGTGLGLAISHRIVSHHQGNLIINSEKGKGTTVKVSLLIQKQT